MRAKEIDLWLAEQLVKVEREKAMEKVKEASEKEFWRKLGLEVIE